MNTNRQDMTDRTWPRRTLYAVIWLLFLPVSADAGEVYKWRDAQGKLHFSDQPPPDQAVEQVRLRSINTIKATSVSILEEPLQDTPDVILYSAEWCGACRTAKRYFRQKGIAYKEYDVEKSRRGKQDYQRLKGRGVPIILVGKQRMDGFSTGRFEQMMRR